MGQVKTQSPRVRIAPPQESDLPALPALLTAAFGPGRFAKTSERVRERGALLDRAMSRLAFEEDRVIGCCLMSHIRIGDQAAVFLGPLAVHPHAQKAGLGAGLVRDCLEAAKAAGVAAVVLVGAPGFFAPLGFAALPKGQVVLPGPVDPARLLGLSLQAGAIEALKGAISGFPAANPA